MLNFLPVLSWKFHPFCSWLNWAHIMFCASQKEFLSSCRWRLQSGWSWCKFQDVLPAPWGLSVNMRSTVTNVQVREKLGKNSNLCLSLKVLWSQPQFSSLRGGCHCLREPPSVSLRSQGHHCKYPVNTATSPLRSAHSLHLRTRHTQRLREQPVWIFQLSGHRWHFWYLPCLSCNCPPFMTPILLLSIGPGGSAKKQFQQL